ncbi:hypothetical protein J6590_025139 [Homalodisca vitripennis]|nr:hypothetical protein J6590_025139 [Homalodisca vitripennis]
MGGPCGLLDAKRDPGESVCTRDLELGVISSSAKKVKSLCESSLIVFITLSMTVSASASLFPFNDVLNHENRKKSTDVGSGK